MNTYEYEYVVHSCTATCQMVAAESAGCRLSVAMVPRKSANKLKYDE